MSFHKKVSKQNPIEIEKQWEQWYEKNKNTIEPIDKKDVKNSLICDLSFLSQMDAREYTLYRKWVEVNRGWPKIKSNPFLGDPETYPELDFLKSKIWIPKSTDDYLKIEPQVIFCNTKELLRQWSILRTFTSTMLNRGNIGRNIKFLIIDKHTDTYLGVIDVSGDFLDLTPRDKFIGWDREIKTGGRINHTAIGSSIVPTQPLGYNFLGGKLLALLTLSDVIENTWNEKYGDKLVGMTTTSLYGTASQYNSLSPWVKRGHSQGSIKYEPSLETVNMVKKWLKYEHTKKYWEWYIAKTAKGHPYKRDYKQRSLSFTYGQLGIDKSIVESKHERGIYFCHYFENSLPFLRGDYNVDQLGVKRFDNSIKGLTEKWQKKATNRIKKLLDNGQYNTDILFYDNIIGMSWEETKEIYLNQVGR